MRTLQAFRDAIESLSPEQQRFAKAFRSMQLASTLFGICVIQIKPQVRVGAWVVTWLPSQCCAVAQLERLLNLPAESLTKEIRLMQDLQSLFIEYQVPSLASAHGAVFAHCTHVCARALDPE